VKVFRNNIKLLMWLYPNSSSFWDNRLFDMKHDFKLFNNAVIMNWGWIGLKIFWIWKLNESNFCLSWLESKSLVIQVMQFWMCIKSIWQVLNRVRVPLDSNHAHKQNLWSLTWVTTPSDLNPAVKNCSKPPF
jgi:hypothetical protein